MASAGNEGLCLLLSSSQQGGFVSCPCLGRTVLLANQVCLWKASFLESSTNIAIEQHKLQVLPAWTNPLHPLEMWDWRARGWWRVWDWGMLLEQLQEYLSLLLKPPEPTPLLGRDWETLAWSRGLTVVPLGLLGDKVRGAAPAGGQPAALFWGIWQGSYCISGHGQD